MTTIKAPYNFVPFNKQVISPHWTEQISHDIPFEDGLSGKIDITLKAESPIFVRDGIGQKQAKENYRDDVQHKSHHFSQYGGKYFIPGTSIKGMIRNVLEILSFGRMEGKVNDHKYALRDLSGAMKNQYLKDFKPDKIFCGWLKKGDDNSYYITDCGIPGRISHREIDRVFGTDFSTYFSRGGGFNFKKDYEKSAQKKYKLFDGHNANQRFVFEYEDAGRNIYKIDLDGDHEGSLVFTGQPGYRQQRNGKWSGHHLEFIFFKGSETERVVPENVMQDFFFAYFEQDKAKWSKDWEVWREKLSRGEEIPVFFHKSGNNIKSLGLSYLYKLPYNNSVLDAITHYQGKGKLDLSDAIFGYVDKNKALKGRVHIGHAFATHAEVDTEKKEVLSGPKASYYPTYMRQNVNAAGAVSKYNTFMDNGAEIAGWKRYPVHANGVKNNPPPRDTNSEKILTKFTPLKAGAEFTFSIRYHNLRPVELGALLSALIFHGTENTFHSIGMAKPLGYGKVSLSISNADQLGIPKYLGVFEAYMNAQLEKKVPTWHTLDQVTELVTMAQEYSGAELEYMNLDEHVLVKNDKDKNKNKKAREALGKYSQLVSTKAEVVSYCNAKAIAEMRDTIAKESKSFLHTENIDEVIQSSLQAAKHEIELEWEKKKSWLLDQLKTKQAEAAKREAEARIEREEIERAKKKEEERLRVQEEGPGFDQIDLSNWRSAKENLIKLIEDFGKKYYKQTNIKKVIEQYPTGYLPAQYHDQLFDILKKIFQILPKKEKEKWNTPYPKNAILKKVAEWVGEKKVREYFIT